MLLNLGKVLHISMGFLFVFISFYSCASISSKLLRDQGYNSLGNISLGIAYVVVAGGSPFASLLVMRASSRLAVQVGSFVYLVYVIGLMVPTLKEAYPDSDIFLFDTGFIYFIVLFCSVIKGMGTSLFWIGGLSYIRECSS